MRSLLVTGGAGFIGSNFVHYWLREHGEHRVVVLDALTYAGNRSSLAGAEQHIQFRFVHGNICDRALVEQILRSESIDTLVHFAAESHVDRSISGPVAFVQTNVVGTQTLLEAVRTVWLRDKIVPRHRFHHVSTDEVFGSLSPDAPAFVETTRYDPSSPYSASKAASDHLVRAYHATYGLTISLSNCSNNYGPYHFPEKLIPLAIVNILHGRPVPIYGDGRNVRDWLHVHDHCRGIDAVLTRGTPGESYNIGGRSEVENLRLIQMLCEVADQAFQNDKSLASRYPDCPAAKGKSVSSLITMVKDRPGHDRRYAIDCSKIERELGYVVSNQLESGLRDTFRWYLDNPQWWRAVMDGSYAHWIEAQYA